MTAVASGKPGSFPGWILVAALLLFCGTGTWLTWWNYSRNVFSSTQGRVLEPEWPETRIAVTFPGHTARSIRLGHAVRVTVGNEKKALAGEVVGPEAPGTPGTEGGAAETVIVRLTEEPPAIPGAPAGWDPHWLPVGTVCSVTVDTTVPRFSRSATESKAPAAPSPSR